MSSISWDSILYRFYNSKRKDRKMMDIPVGSTKQDLVYKSTPQRDLKLTFLPPITEKYEKAPVYFLIPAEDGV